MDFDLNAEQKMLKKSAREFFSKEVDAIRVRELEADKIGHDGKLWKKMVQLGWMGLMVPEEYGGEGFNFLDMAVVLEEFGASALPSPFFISSVVSALLLMDAANGVQKEKLLPALASGTKIFTMAWCEKNGSMSPSDITSNAVLKEGRYEISGRKIFVPYAHISDYQIVAARTADDPENGDFGISLFLVDCTTPGLYIDIIDDSTGGKYCEVSMEKVAVSEKNLIGGLNRGWEILETVFLKSAVAECSKMVGAADKVLKMVVDYAKERVQFGRPVGSFQAIQHHCANMKTLFDTSVYLTHKASWKISVGEKWEKEASMCKAWAGESLRQMIMLGHQVMGGYGFIEEVDLQLYYRRSRDSEQSFGNSAYHRERVARVMDL